MKDEVPAMTTEGEDILAIKQLAAAWRSGWVKGDAKALISLYADQPVLMPQDQPAVMGKEAIRVLYDSVLKDYQIDSESTLMEVDASGDLGYFWSAYKLRAVPRAGGPAIESAGKSIFIVRRQRDGSWKIARLIDNSDGQPR